jgi:hypothetical protein
MPNVRKEEKQIKKDQHGVRDVREEVGEEIREGSRTQPIVKNPNRDKARGDWDRTGDHHDEGSSRSEEEDNRK